MAGPLLVALCCGASARLAAGGQVFTVGAFLRPPVGRREALEQHTALISDPDSGHYGEHLAQAEIIEAISMPPGRAEATAEWLTAVLRSHRDPRILSHGDAVTLALTNYSLTYQLGAWLQNASVAGAANEVDGAVPALPLPPEEVELVVTPSMPPHFCRELGDVGKSACLSNPPCRWLPRSKTNARCAGDSPGWICWPDVTAWPTPRWRCFEPALEAGNGKFFGGAPARHLRRGRRGRRWPAGATDSEAGQRSREDEEEALPRISASLGFRVLPKSEGLLLVYRSNSSGRNATFANGSEAAAGGRRQDTTWHSVELTWRQDGAYQSQVLGRRDFEPRGRRLLVARVRGLTNLRPVDSIAVCLHENLVEPAGLRRDSEELGGDIPQAGCQCNVSRGTDEQLGRRCERLAGMSPTEGPVDFVLPRGPQSLSTLQRDLGIPAGSRATGQGATQAVGEFDDEAFLQEDVLEMHRAVGIRQPPPEGIGVIGPDGSKGEQAGVDTAGEGSLDVQVITTLAPGSPTSWIAVEPYCMDGFMLAYASRLNDHAAPPLVHSISWGAAEALFPPAFVRRLDYELMKLALRGVTMIIASGDNGISSVTANCTFIPDVVGSSPWVTSVGATLPSLASAPYCTIDGFSGLGSCEEPGPITCATTAGAIITSSGYWSLYRARPKYQDAAVATYLHEAPCNPCRTDGSMHTNRTAARLKAPCQHINKRGCSLSRLVGMRRGSPDVALPGASYPVLVNRSLVLMDGTSASAPAFAAMVSLLNSEQLGKGRPPLGFLNPWLYRTYQRHSEAFTDVVVGDTGSTEAQICEWGWRAVPGWDPATGLGVPLFAELRERLPGRRQPEGPPAAVEAASEGGEPPGLPALGGAPWPAWHSVGLAAAACPGLLAAGLVWKASRRRGAELEQLSAATYHALPGSLSASFLSS